MGKKLNRPVTTLFMIESLDGKISSGESDNLDVDKDWKKIDGVKEGLNQYYKIEQTTDLFSLNTGRVMVKIGVNERKEIPQKSPCSFVIIDNQPHLNENGIKYLCNWVTKLYLVTTNKNHVAYKVANNYHNMEILSYETFDAEKLFTDLKEKYFVDNLTVQSGGNMNSLFVRSGLIDYVHVVVAPLLVGGRTTPTLIDGDSIKENELFKLKPLELIDFKVLNNSYLELKYKIKNN